MPRHSFAAKLRAARRTRTQNQHEAARALGVPLGTYVQWEQGRFVPGTFKQRAVLEKMK